MCIKKSKSEIFVPAVLPVHLWPIFSVVSSAFHLRILWLRKSALPDLCSSFLGLLQFKKTQNANFLQFDVKPSVSYLQSKINISFQAIFYPFTSLLINGTQCTCYAYFMYCRHCSHADVWVKPRRWFGRLEIFTDFNFV